MRVIDLFIKIANGEELPKKFVYVDKENIRYVFELEEDKDYWCEELGDWFFNNFSIQTILNDELEIIEEDKEIEEIEIGTGLTEVDCAYKINEIIKNHNKIMRNFEELKKGK
jgi:hypothetical protein